MRFIGTIRKISLISVIAIKQFVSFSWTRFIIKSIESYWTAEFSFGILALPELSLGYDRSWIIRNWPGVNFGTTPKGDEINGSKGGWEKGPSMRLSLKPSWIWVLMISEYFNVEACFFAIVEVSVETQSEENLKLKPLTKNGCNILS